MPSINSLLARNKNVGPVPLLSVQEILAALEEATVNKVITGYSTGWQSLDNYLKVIKQALYVVTGIPSHGKGTWTKNLMVNTARIYKWQWLVFVPEDFPRQHLMTQFAEIYLNRRLTNNDDLPAIAEYIDRHFHICGMNEDNPDLDSILATAERIKAARGLDGVLIDPYNELMPNRPHQLSETDYIGHQLMTCRKFAQMHDVSFWVCAHPTKLQKTDKDTYKPPTLYEISGSAHWFNKPMFGLTVYRNEIDDTEIHIQKVRFRYYGNKGICKLKFNLESGTYSDLPQDSQHQPLWS